MQMFFKACPSHLADIHADVDVTAEGDILPAMIAEAVQDVDTAGADTAEEVGPALAAVITGAEEALDDAVPIP